MSQGSELSPAYVVEQQRPSSRDDGQMRSSCGQGYVSMRVRVFALTVSAASSYFRGM